MKKVLLAALLGLSLAGHSFAEGLSPSTSLKDEISDIQRRLDSLERNTSSLEEKLKNLEGKLALLEIVVRPITDVVNTTVFLTPDSENFSTITTPLGPIVVSLKKLKPYATGSEFTVGVVNTSSVILTDVSFHVEVYKTSDTSTLGSSKEARNQYKKNGSTLPVGKEVNLTFRVQDIPPTDFQRVSIACYVGGISYKVGK